MDGVEYGLAWVALVFVCADAYVLWRLHTTPEAGRRALSSAVRVAGAGVAGFIIALGLVFVALIVAIFEWFANEGQWGGWRSTLLVLAALCVLIGLPVGATVAQRRRQG